MLVYLIGSLRNPLVPEIGNQIRAAGHEVFDDWHAAGPHADDEWQRYENSRGHNYREALNGWAARNTFRFDFTNLHRSDCAVLVLPAGKSGHLELGFMAGLGKKTYILFDVVPERYDVMYRFANDVFFSVPELLEGLKND